jgi:hypothetical protein
VICIANTSLHTHTLTPTHARVVRTLCGALDQLFEQQRILAHALHRQNDKRRQLHRNAVNASHHHAVMNTCVSMHARKRHTHTHNVSPVSCASRAVCASHSTRLQTRSCPDELSNAITPAPNDNDNMLTIHATATSTQPAQRHHVTHLLLRVLRQQRAGAQRSKQHRVRPF